MSCNCKNEKSMDSMIENNGQNNTSNNFIKYTFKILAFTLFLVVSPIVFLLVIWIVFKMLVLNNSVDIIPMLQFIANKIKEKDYEEDDYLDEDITEDDLIMVDVEDITDKK